MTDDTPTPYQPLKRLKRLAITFAILFGLWLALRYIVPYFMAVPVTTPAALPPVAPSATALPDYTARLEALEARVKALEEKPQAAPAAPDERVSELSEKMTSQQTEVADLKKTIDEGNRRLAALTLFGQLKETALAGNAYRGELREFTALMQGDETFVPLIAKLSPAAENGLPTLASLQHDFAAAMDKALAPKSDGWSEKMHGLIHIRKVGEQKGADDEAVIARAETRLRADNIAQALKELEQLSPPAADAMNGWKKQAGDYLAARDALDALQVALFKPTAAPHE